MKSLTIEFEIPDWANYVAKDLNGDVYVFENEPEVDKNRLYWDGEGKTYRLTQLRFDENWQSTLRKI